MSAQLLLGLIDVLGLELEDLLVCVAPYDVPAGHYCVVDRYHFVTSPDFEFIVSGTEPESRETGDSDGCGVR
ncbi:MAG TPA: hypothetical protein VHL50_03215 [Pyrinomonadaceae bacterium]|nr:hypothetical protein [Pyrinomonadaceae bacterium]